jgi:hypothetical protein
MERLLAHTDADRHVTVVFASQDAYRELITPTSPPLMRLREPMFWFLGDEPSATAVSLHWDDNFFVEFLAIPTLDTSPELTARVLAGRVAQLPERLQDYVNLLDPHPYGRRVVERFPAMVRQLATYTRSGVEGDHAVLRCYLPGIAGHNLLLGAELTLAAATGTDRRAGSSPTPIAQETVRNRLHRRTSLSFARETLEAALEQLSRDIEVPIVILGADLQAEGITKNQSISINVENRPAAEILVEILRLANPDKTATGPDDVRQKLVYVIRAGGDAGDSAQILITTRAAAAERGDDLPPEFRANAN